MIIEQILDSNFEWILEVALLALIACYFLFAILVVRQVRLLVSNIETNLSLSIFMASVAHLVISFLALVAAIGLVF